MSRIRHRPGGIGAPGANGMSGDRGAYCGTSILNGFTVAVSLCARLAALHGGFTIVGNRTVFGATTTQIAAQVDTCLANDNPQFLLFDAGTNDIVNSTQIATDLPAWKQLMVGIFNACKAKSCTPIPILQWPVGQAADVVPRTVNNHIVYHALRKLCAAEDVIPLDPRAPGVEDPATGYWATGMNLPADNGTHPSTLANKLMCDFMVPQLQGIVPPKTSIFNPPHTNVTYSTAATPVLLGEPNLLGNPMMSVADGTATPSNTGLPTGTATGWRKVDFAGSGTTSSAVRDDASFYTGKAWECVSVAGRSTRFEFVIPSVMIPPVGRVVRVQAKIKVVASPEDDTGSNGSCFFGNFSNSSPPPFGFASAFTGVSSRECVVNSTSTFTTGLILTTAAGKTPWTVRFGDFSAIDVTNL